MPNIALSGALEAIGTTETPVLPLNLLGDFAGGGLMLAFGLLAAVLHARSTGQGQVIDAAMTDGASLLTAMIHGFRGAGAWTSAREANLLDGGAWFYSLYPCADGKHLAVGCIEPQFRAAFLTILGLTDLGPNPRAIEAMGYRDPDQFIDAPQMGPDGKPQMPPNPAAQQAHAKMQEKQLELQADMQAKQAQMQMDAQLERERMQMQQQTDVIRQRAEAEQQAMRTQYEMQLKEQQMAYDNERRAREMEFQRWKAELDAAVRIQVAQVNSKNKLTDPATQAAVAEVASEVRQ